VSATLNTDGHTTLSDYIDAVVMIATNERKFYESAIVHCKRMAVGGQEFKDYRIFINKLRFTTACTFAINANRKYDVCYGALSAEFAHRIAEYYSEEVTGGCATWDREKERYVDKSIEELQDEIVDHMSNALDSFKQVQEKVAMSDSIKPAKVESHVFVDGIKGSDLTDDQIFAKIASHEAEIERLSKIKTRPKKLLDRITEIEDGISAMVDYVDNRK